MERGKKDLQNQINDWDLRRRNDTPNGIGYNNAVHRLYLSLFSSLSLSLSLSFSLSLSLSFSFSLALSSRNSHVTLRSFAFLLSFFLSFCVGNPCVSDKTSRANVAQFDRKKLAFSIYYVPWSSAVCKRFHDKMRLSHLVVKSLLHGAWGT